MDGQRNEHELCQVRSMLNEPSAELVDEKGHVFHWAQSLTRPATQEEIIAYWKAQAESWKRRAEKHGCDVENGDPDCG
jgi:hypothetical protein